MTFSSTLNNHEHFKRIPWNELFRRTNVFRWRIFLQICKPYCEDTSISRFVDPFSIIHVKFRTEVTWISRLKPLLHVVYKPARYIWFSKRPNTKRENNFFNFKHRAYRKSSKLLLCPYNILPLKFHPTSPPGVGTQHKILPVQSLLKLCLHPFTSKTQSKYRQLCVVRHVQFRKNHPGSIFFYWL